jgi:hypothetical protein
MAIYVVRTNNCSILAFTEDDENQELMDLIQSFRVEASKLLGMLDVSNSTVARLKVLSAKYIGYFCNITLLYFLLFLLQEKNFTPMPF